MALIGENIDPRLFVQDYSGYANAANSNADAISGAVGQVTNAYKDYGKEQKEAKNALKAGQVQIEAAMKLFPDQAEYLGQIANELKNEDTPLSARAEISKQTADYISMAVGQKRYETDQYYREKELGFRERDQSMQERESQLRQHVTSLNVTQAENEMAASALDQQTKATIGPALLESVIAMAPKSIADSVRSQMGEYDDAEKFSLANSIMGLIPKAERRAAPAVTEVPVPGGTQKMQWDETSGQFIPIQTSVSPVESGDPTNPDLPIYTPADATDEDLSGLLPPLGSIPRKGGAAPTVGFTPAVTPEEATKKALELQKLQGDVAGQKVQAEQAAATVVNNKVKAELALASLKEIRNHPGRWAATGATSYLPTARGSDAFEFEKKLDQAKALAGTIGIEAMRGLGPMSEKEFQAAKDAIAQLELGQKTETIEKELDKLITLFETKIGSATNPDGSPKTIDPAADISAKIRASRGQ
jgi:hypothetical protein